MNESTIEQIADVEMSSDTQFLLDGLGVSSLAELKRLVDLGREHDGTALHGEALLGVPLS